MRLFCVALVVAHHGFRLEQESLLSGKAFRIVTHWALANSVPSNPSGRSICNSTSAIDEKYSRN